MRARAWMLAAAIISTTIGSGCTTTRYVSEPLPLPARPRLPAVTAAELAPLAPDVYVRLEARDRGRRQYAEELEAILCGTWANPAQCLARQRGGR